MKTNKSSDEYNTMRLAKTMAHRGICSRREADTFILKGWVSVNGEVVSQKGFPVSQTDKIELSPEAERVQQNRITIVINKPVGFVSAQPEKGYAAAVSLITTANHWKGDKTKRKFSSSHLAGLAPAGRLDIDSKGLLVLTSDGKTARKLVASNGTVEKEYLVRVEGKIKDGGLDLLNKGLWLDGEKLRPAQVVWQNENQLHFVLRQGKKRQIRRMCELVGLKVIGLKRVRIGSVRLGNLPEGKWRYLGKDEFF